MMENTNRSVAAFEGLRIVGFARALCDEVTNGYVSMVAVAADKRGQGIGSELCVSLSRTMVTSPGSCVQAAAAMAFGQRWDSRPPQLQWKDAGFEPLGDPGTSWDRSARSALFNLSSAWKVLLIAAPGQI